MTERAKTQPIVVGPPAAVVFPGGKAIIHNMTVNPDLETVDKWIREGTCSDGYLQIDRDHGVDVLLIYRKQVHCALRVSDYVLSALPIPDFVSELERSPAARVTMQRTESGLVLLMAVATQSRPAIRVPNDLVRPEALLTGLARRGKTSAMMINNGVEYAFAYFAAGEVRVVFLPNGQIERNGDALVEYLRRHANDPLSIDVFFDLATCRDPYSTVPLHEVTKGGNAAPPLFLTVRHGALVLERRIIRTGGATIGRSPTCDIVIDHETVSRQHCIIEWGNGVYLVADSNSANGTLLNGRRVRTSALHVGDSLMVGDFEVRLGEEAEVAGPSTLETVFLAASASAAKLEYGDQVIPLSVPVFTIGKAPNASLVVKGLLMKPIQASVVREGQHYRLVAAEGGKKVTRNDDEVDTTGVTLTSGDTIGVGGYTLKFVT